MDRNQMIIIGIFLMFLFLQIKIKDTAIPKNKKPQVVHESGVNRPVVKFKGTESNNFTEIKSFFTCLAIC